VDGRAHVVEVELLLVVVEVLVVVTKVVVVDPLLEHGRHCE
jgi:hypothetical protein